MSLVEGAPYVSSRTFPYLAGDTGFDTPLWRQTLT